MACYVATTEFVFEKLKRLSGAEDFYNLFFFTIQVKKPEGKYQKTSTGAVKMQPKAEELKFVTKNDGYVHIHPSSVNYQVRILSFCKACWFFIKEITFA